MISFSTNFFNYFIKPQKERDYLLTLIPSNSVCAEIGVWKGEFAEQIVRSVKPKRLYLVDPWKFFPEYHRRMYGGAVASSQNQMDEIYKDVVKSFARKKETLIIRDLSSKASKRIKNGSVDFVYIDGNHSFEYVYEDLGRYYKKLKRGGILAGDDFFWGIKERFPVARAALKFATKNKLHLIITGRNFFIRKETS